MADVQTWGGTTVLMDAHTQWASRPDDQRFLTLEELHRATLDRANLSDVDLIKNQAVRLVAREIEDQESLLALPEKSAVRQHGYTLDVEMEAGGSSGPVALVPNHWSFAQLCQRAKVPAKWLRNHTHPTIAEQALNFGLLTQQDQDDIMVLHYGEDGSVVREMRAVTSPSYGRIYDHKIVEAVQRVNHAGNWVVPSASYSNTNPKRATTLYASDRDVFIFLVDPSRPIEVTTPDGRQNTLFRGFMTWNSEVGKSSFGLMTFLYNVVCDNRIVWGAQEVKELRIRHSLGAPDRFEREGQILLSKYAESSPQSIEESLKTAMTDRVGKDDDKVGAFLRKNRFTAAESKKIIEKAREEEGAAETRWDLVQGGTALARGIQHTDQRVDFERRVSSLLDKTAA